MNQNQKSTRPHSAEYFGEERDHWWNNDFLDLMAHRLDLRSVTSLVDVGCGVGHWTTLLHPRLATGATILGLDRDPDNVVGFKQRINAIFPDPGTIRARVGDAYALDLPNGFADATTCQTLLLHLDNPEIALAEMVRITKPGGLVFCAEPNNLVSRLPFNGLMENYKLDSLLRQSEMAWRYILGKRARKLGDECIGERLPGMFAQAGLENVRVWLSDKAAPALPPYQTAAEQADLMAHQRWREDSSGPFDRAEMRANVLAGGATEEFCEKAWTEYLNSYDSVLSYIAEGKWHAAGGTLFYLVAGTVPT